MTGTTVTVSNGAAVVRDYAAEVARGAIDGAEVFGAIGERTSGAAVTDVAIGPAEPYFIGAAGGQLSIVSTSANDAAAGTGARTIRLQALDANLDRVNIDVTLNGLTPVLTVATNIRWVNTTIVTTTGSGKKAAGVITVSYSGNEISRIAAGELISQSTIRRVPAGKAFFCRTIIAGMTSGNAQARGHVDLASNEVDLEAFGSAGLFFPRGAIALQDGSDALTLDPPIRFGPGTVVMMQVTSDKANYATGTYFGWLEDV